MPRYRYIAVPAAGGAREEVTIEADSAAEAAGKLRSRAMLPLSFLGEEGAADSRKIFKAHADGYEFTSQLAPLLAANIPLERALAILVESTTDDAMKELATSLRQGLHEGKKFSELIRSCGSTFPGFYAPLYAAEVYLALDYCRKRGTLTDDERKAESYRICKEFFSRIPKIREYIETDLEAAYDGDPAAGCHEEIILAYPGLRAITIYRIAHELYLEMVPVLPRLMTEYAHSRTGIDIHPGATIDKYFFIDHGTGIVIGETAVIGKNVKIYQGVTIGALSTRGGQRLSGKKRHPTICDNVTIYAGASILGGETVIGENAVIGGNTFITRSIDANTRVSMKNLEMEYRTGGNERRSEEISQGEAWYYMI